MQWDLAAAHTVIRPNVLAIAAAVLLRGLDRVQGKRSRDHGF